MRVNNGVPGNPAGVPPMQPALRFAAVPGDDQIHLKRTKLKHTWRQVLLVAPLTSLLGGVALMTSAVLPSHHASTPTPPAHAAVQPQVRPVTPAQQDALDNVKDILVKLGWTLASIGAVTGGLNGLSAGYGSKQPSMLLGSMGQILTAPILVVDPSIAARGALMTTIAMFISGLANKMHNDFSLSPGEATREFDMSPLLNKKALRQIAGSDDPSAMQLAKAWVAQAGKTLRFVGDDQVLMVSNSGKAVGQLALHPGQTLKRQKRAVSQLSQFVRRRRKEIPDFLKPSGIQAQTGAMLMYMGSVPLLLLSGSVPAVTDIGTKLIAAGSLTENGSMLAIGMNDKKFASRALLVGIPSLALGNANLGSEWGYGASCIGQAALANFFRDVADEAQRVNSEPSP